MSIVRARAPLRLGLAGGGSDVSPYCDTYGGYVMNTAIGRCAYTTLRTLDVPLVRFVAADRQCDLFVEATFPLQLDGNFDLHKATYNFIVGKYNGGNPLSLELTTFCDAPVGSGLGSSSTLVVSMVRAFVEFLKVPLDEYSIARAAYHIERIDCGFQGGRQDQYSATFGGFNFIEFYSEERVIVNPLRIKSSIVCELESSIILYFTGVSRESDKIIAEQINNVELGLEDTLSAMHGVKHEALAMKESLLRGDFEGLIESLRLGWKSKKRSSKAVSNLHIDQIYDAAIGAGALAGKVSGAGGGGFMWFFVPIVNRTEVTRRLESFGGYVSNCQFVKHGAQAWRIG